MAEPCQMPRRMHCLLCKLDFLDKEDFKVHVLKMHKPMSDIWDVSDTEEDKDVIYEVDESRFDNSENPYNKIKDEPILDYDSIPDQLPLPGITGGFRFTSKNIQIWLVQFKQLMRSVKYPLDKGLFNHINYLHKEIFDRYSSASTDDVTPAVLKVYEELNNIIHKHISSVQDKL